MLGIFLGFSDDNTRTSPAGAEGRPSVAFRNNRRLCLRSVDIKSYGPQIIEARETVVDSWCWEQKCHVGAVNTQCVCTIYESCVTHLPSSSVCISFRLICERFLLDFGPFSNVTPRVPPETNVRRFPTTRN